MDIMYERLSVSLCEADVASCCNEYSSDADAMEHLFRLVFDDNKKVASNAAWLLTRMPLGSVAFMQKWQDRLIDLAVNEKESVTLRRLSLNMLYRQTFDVDRLRADFIDYCLSTMVAASETPGIRSLCVKLGYVQCRLIPELLGEYMQYAELLEQQPLPPAVSSAINNVMKTIKKKR